MSTFVSFLTDTVPKLTDMPKEERGRRKGPVFYAPRRTVPRAKLGVHNAAQDSLARAGGSKSRGFTLRTDAEGRRGYRTDEYHHASPQTATPQDPDLSQHALNVEDSPPSPSSEPSEAQECVKSKRKQKNTTSVSFFFRSTCTWLHAFQTKLLEWLSFRQSSLDEILRHDGLGSYLGQTKCHTCGEEKGAYKCRDCFDGSLLRCQRCVVGSHKVHPLHRVEVFKFYQSLSISSAKSLY